MTHEINSLDHQWLSSRYLCLQLKPSYRTIDDSLTRQPAHPYPHEQRKIHSLVSPCTIATELYAACAVLGIRPYPLHDMFETRDRQDHKQEVIAKQKHKKVNREFG